MLYGQSRNQNLQNLPHVFRGKRQVALTGVKGNVRFGIAVAM